MGSTVSRKSYLFTSESVSEGHPDKVCDRISDEVVDLFFREGPKAGVDPWQLRVACETMATTNQVVIAGETRGPNTITKDWVSHVARLAIKPRFPLLRHPVLRCCEMAVSAATRAALADGQFLTVFQQLAQEFADIGIKNRSSQRYTDNEIVAVLASLFSFSAGRAVPGFICRFIADFV